MEDSALAMIEKTIRWLIGQSVLLQRDKCQQGNRACNDNRRTALAARSATRLSQAVCRIMVSQSLTPQILGNAIVQGGFKLKDGFS